MGWYTFGDEPVPWHVDFQTRFKKEFECPHALFMLRHHNQLSESDGEENLPFTIYESSSQDGDGMEVDPPYEQLAAKFRQTFISLETSAEEAIVLADVVQLATNAAQQSSGPVATTESKGKGKAVDAQESEGEPNYLSAEEEEREFGQRWQSTSNAYQ
jgi:hypothetical protein